MILHTPASHSRFAIRGLPALAPDRVAVGLGRVLDDAYHYVRHPSPSGLDPVDAVVVGPGGTWALTLSHERGRFRKRNGHWYRWNGSTESWIPWDATPITATRLAGHRLAHLGADGSHVLQRLGALGAAEGAGAGVDLR